MIPVVQHLIISYNVRLKSEITVATLSVIIWGGTFLQEADTQSLFWWLHGPPDTGGQGMLQTVIGTQEISVFLSLAVYLKPTMIFHHFFLHLLL